MEYCLNNTFGDGIGWNYGVSKWIKNIKQGLKDNGWVINPSAPLCISIGLPRALHIVSNKINIFMTLFETEDLFASDYEELAKADLIIVPCKQNQEVLEKALPGKIISVVFGGIDPTIYKYRNKKREKNSPFTFLYVGALNPRKGFDIAEKAFNKVHKTHPNTRLYIKTTEQGKEGIQNKISQNELNSSITYDYRNLSEKELAKLYSIGDCLLLPSHGEGIGLTVLEALASGVPSLHTPYGGLSSIDSIIPQYYSLPYSLTKTTLDYYSSDGSKKSRATRWAEPDFEELILRMERFVYDKSLSSNKDLKKYSRELLDKYNWKRYARNIIAMIYLHIISKREIPPYKKILNIGCGNKQFPWAINLDNRKEVNPDIIYDLRKIPMKFARDEEYDEILCLNILEHFVDIIPFMKELNRITKKDGLIHIQVPYYKGPNVWIDPTHHHGFHEQSMDFFDKSTYHGSINNYANINLKIIHRELLPTDDLYFILQKKCNDCSKGECSCAH